MNEFDIEEESLEDNSNNLFMNLYVHQYDKSKYILKYTIIIMMNSNILSNNVICSQCHKLMIFTNNKSYKDGLVWRCAKEVNNVYDIKKKYKR